MKALFRFAVARLSEVSTYKGAILILTAVGANIRPELATAITSLGLALAGLLGVVAADPGTTAVGADGATPAAP